MLFIVRDTRGFSGSLKVLALTIIVNCTEELVLTGVKALIISLRGYKFTIAEP